MPDFFLTAFNLVVFLSSLSPIYALSSVISPSASQRLRIKVLQVLHDQICRNFLL